MSVRCHCKSDGTVSQMLLSVRCYCQSDVTVSQMLLSVGCHCQTDVTVSLMSLHLDPSQMSLSVRCQSDVSELSDCQSEVGPVLVRIQSDVS